MKIAIIVAALLGTAVALPSLGSVLGGAVSGVANTAANVVTGVTGTVGGVVAGVGTIAGTVPSTVNGMSTATQNLLNNLPVTLQANYVNVAELLVKASNGSANFDTLLYFLLTGVYLSNDGTTNTTNSIGGLGLPTATLCQFGAQYQYSSCYICDRDCYVAHNLWGGECGPSPITGNLTCLCAESAEEAAAKNFTADSSTSCAAYNPAANAVSFPIAIAFRLRSLLLQCIPQKDGTFDSTGCGIDCAQNHGFVSGTCQYQVPNVVLPYGTYGISENAQSDKPIPFCVCSHDNSPNTTYSVPAPQN